MGIFSKPERVILKEGSSASQQVLCPKCGEPMVLRTARRGEHAGKQFYGCSNYPYCRGRIAVGE